MTMNVRGLYEAYEISFLWWGQHMRPCAAWVFFCDRIDILELIRLIVSKHELPIVQAYSK